MDAWKQARSRQGLSQRRLAQRAGVSFRALQMIEAGTTDPRLSSLVKISSALGIPGSVIPMVLDRVISEGPDAVVGVSRRICAEGDASWKLWLFGLVDAFRRCPAKDLVASPPVPETSDRIRSLIASTVETLCGERNMPPPWWCGGVGPLTSPWFVADVENLKATALVESPAPFRKRNIFVLGNFLARA
ncbi:MAG: helix-turn-helix domain-containing protein [Lentisphaeria bacterium]|nr:helix-turn-helix domain-containing protein [Lentisphaeria bacterium]